MTQIGEGLPFNESDVDNGNTVLTSPVFDLSGYNSPHITYYYWFKNTGGNSSPNDQFLARLNNGTQTVTFQTATETNATTGEWVPMDIAVSDFITPTNTMQIIFETGDSAPGHLVEAGVDKFTVYEGEIIGIDAPATTNNKVVVTALPNPFNEQIRFTIQQPDNSPTQSYQLTLTSIDGRVISRTLFASNTLTLLRNRLPQGLLLYTLEQGNKTIANGKIIAQ